MSPSDGSRGPKEEGTESLVLAPEAPALLLNWYGRGHRILPWRDTRDPYRIWVSEIMLQQTTVATVLRFYPRFLVRFPDVGVLASAPAEEVLRLWEGLGYYQRARNLHRAASQIRMGPDGALWPRTIEEWMALPGVGRSTAGAILSISSGIWAPILDANVRRVTERFFGVSREGPRREKRLWEGSNLWGEGREKPGETNQALMELGATVCLPKGPRCPKCPVASLCRSAGSVPEAPRSPAKPGKVRHRVALLSRDGPIAFAPRNEGRLLEGLLDFPGFPAEELRPGTVIFDGPYEGFRVVRTLFSLRQVYSHFTEHVHVTLVTGPDGGVARDREAGDPWEESIGRARTLGLTGVARKIVERLEQEGRRG